ncbi:NAD(P)-dependent oxidoreductase [Sphingobium xenophagum]|uniref:NAD(P)-dependent oxidoreductase n=1 Tax=Sphingobium xenophagum TaxID=121428 RepID=A0A249MSL9_SPHXE|nr:NAD(P)H-binding protein [Sphingobium xenophagum]ASY44127.1 NAD(P)-dependent oxidoreductase [Sphingobium xenophagum]
MYAVTGASGQLGRLVIDALLATVEPGAIVALVRDPAKLADLESRGVHVRAFDYGKADTLVPALDGVKRLLLISSSEVGQREAQHRAVIAAAKAAGVGFLAYTSILHADSNSLDLAVEHRATEAAITQSGLPHALLRNGWYIENFTMNAGAEVEHGAVMGSAGAGRISAATRADYAAAAAAVLTGPISGSQIYELAGDESFTLSDYAAALAAASGKPVVYMDMPQADFCGALEGIGVPAPWPAILSETSAKIALDVLYDDGRALNTLIGRPTTSLAEGVKSALAE